jgi:hypothetical protein
MTNLIGTRRRRKFIEERARCRELLYRVEVLGMRIIVTGRENQNGCAVP